MPHLDKAELILQGLSPLPDFYGDDIKSWSVWNIYTDPAQTKYVLEIRRELENGAWERGLVEIQGRLLFTPTAIRMSLGTTFVKVGVVRDG